MNLLQLIFTCRFVLKSECLQQISLARNKNCHEHQYKNSVMSVVNTGQFSRFLKAIYDECDGWILWVNWTGSYYPRCLVSDHFWVCLWGCFLERLAFGSGRLSGAIALPYMGGCHIIVWGPVWNQRMEEGALLTFLPSCLHWTSSVFYSWTEIHIMSSLVFRL